MRGARLKNNQISCLELLESNIYKYCIQAAQSGNQVEEISVKNIFEGLMGPLEMLGFLEY